jgi:DnaK suppressor protein
MALDRVEVIRNNVGILKAEAARFSAAITSNAQTAILDRQTLTGDDGDAALQSANEDSDAGVAANLNMSDEQTAHAIDAIRGNMYGICEMCNIDIPTARLDARPQATKCVPCQAEEEARTVEWQ